MCDTNQVPHPGPTIVRRHRTKFSHPGNRRAALCASGVCFRSWSNVWRHISRSLSAASWNPSRYVVSLLLFSERQPRQPTGPSGFSFLPAFRNCTSQQLAVHLRQMFLLYCSVFRLHVLCAALWEPYGKDVLLLRFKRERAWLKAVSGLLWLSVCSRRQLETQNWENYT